MKTCSKCKTQKTVQSFNRNSTNRDGLQSWCRECTTLQGRLRTSFPKVTAEYRRKLRYGITEETYQSMLSLVNNCCPVCTDPFSDSDFNKNAVVDHDHTCCAGSKTCGRCIRGLLCRQCNMLIGKIEKMADPLLATQRIVNYLGATKPLV